MEQQTRVGLSDAKRQLLSRYLSGKRTHSCGEALATAPLIPRRSSGNIAPQSFNQEQVWTHVQLMGGKPAYNQLITIHRRGPLNVATLERVLDELNQRHEIWRTTFEMGAEEPVQIIHDEPPKVKLRLFDLRTLTEADRAEQSERLAAADGSKPFNLRSLPLWRAILVQVADHEFHLHMNLHQLVLDGSAMHGILLPELIRLYDAFSQDKPSPFSESAPQYADFSAWQRAKLNPGELAPHLAWWMQKLAGELPRLAWPTYKPRPELQTYGGATEMLFLPAEVANPLRAFADRESATLFMALTAGFFGLLHSYTGQTDLILGMPIAARTPETEGIMGSVMSMLPLRLDLSGNPTFREVLGRVRSGVLDALDHGVVPLLRLIDEVRPPRDPSRNPLFQIMISLEPPRPPVDPAWDLTLSGASSGSSIMDMYFLLDARPNGLMAPVQYNPDLFDAADVRRMFADWQSILVAGLADPDRPVAEFPLTKIKVVQDNATPDKRTFAGRLKGWLKR